MNIKKQNGTNLESLIELLESKDGAKRQNARKSLVVLGQPAVASLINILKNSDVNHVRWEAVKALGTICDSRAIPALVNALEDNDSDVGWAAAEALKKYKKGAWSILLQALINNGVDSVLMRNGAHHIFRNQKQEGFNNLLKALLTALDPGSVPESAAVAAYDILQHMEKQ